MELALLLVTFMVTLALGVPVAICLALASLAYMLVAGLPIVILPQRMYAGMDVFVLLCIPGFILAGNLMNYGGVTERIIRLANALVGWMRGGLAMANVADSMMFGGVSGTAVADVAATGSVMIPGMKKSGYPADFSAAITAASSTVGPMLPPSVPMIIVGALSGISVGQLFLAGAVPGILMGIGMGITCYVISVRRNYPRMPWQGWGELVSATLSASWALAMIALIIGGLVTGMATPTETAVVACIYAFLVGTLVYRELPLSKVPRIIIDSAISSAGILALVGFANVFGSILASERIPQALAQTVLSITDNPLLVILLINILLLIVGMFMETIAALIILFVPLLTLATSVGIDPVHFATFAVLNLMIGLTTPPVGVCLFVACNIARIPLLPVIKAIMPFLLSNIIVLLLVSYYAPFATWLPNAVMGN